MMLMGGGYPGSYYRDLSGGGGTASFSGKAFATAALIARLEGDSGLSERLTGGEITLD